MDAPQADAGQRQDRIQILILRGDITEILALMNYLCMAHAVSETK